MWFNDSEIMFFNSKVLYSVIILCLLNDVSVCFKLIDWYLYILNIVYKFIILCVKILRMFKKEWVYKKWNLSLNMKFG